MLPLSRLAILHPRKTMLLAALAVIAMAPGMTRLKLRTDGQALLPSEAPEVIHDRAIRKEFGLADSIIVLIRHDAPEGIFNTQTLGRVVELTQRLQHTEGLRPFSVARLVTLEGRRPSMC